MKLLVCALLCFFASLTQNALAAGSPVISSMTRAMQDVLNDARVKSGTPGTSATILVGGRLVWHGVSGTVDLRTGRPVTFDTMYSLASVSKLFTSTIALRLMEEGKLRLEDPISRYVPAYVPDARIVTVKELLGHTSGYPDDEGNGQILKWLADPNYPWRRADIMRAETLPTFAPGTRFSYCNSCFVMLGAVIESAGGSTVGSEFDRLIADPLGLYSSVDYDQLARFAPRIARGYDLQHGRLVDTFVGARDLGVPTSIWGPVWTDGGVVATSDGVAAFTDALMGGRILKPATLALMVKTGPDHEHGLDAETYVFDSHRWRGHSGFYYGFTAESWYDASRRLTITVLTNRTDDADPATVIWNRIAQAYDKST
jgi:D-alanyl-D-alanine carboxypeptidase